MEERPLKTLKAMLKERGLKAEDFEQVGNPLDQTRMYTFAGVLIIFSEKTSLSETKLNSFLSFASENNYTSGIIIVTPAKPSEKVLETVRQHISQPENPLLQIFYSSHLNFEYAWHRKVPKHRLLTEEEKTKLMKDLNMTTLKQLRKIDSQDAMAKWIGARPGDVVEITGLDLASGEGKRWSYCLANVYEP